MNHAQFNTDQCPSATTRIVQVSDLHIDPDKPEHRDRLKLIRDALAQQKPDLIITTGDLSDDGYGNERRLRQMREELERWPAPVLCVPGNHDVGNKVGVGFDEVTGAAVDTWKRVLDSDHFALTRGRWMMLGINSQIIGSDFPEEAQQRRWLDEQLGYAEAQGLFVCVFLHMPMYIRRPDEVFAPDDVSGYWSPSAEARDAMLERLSRPCVRLVASGHVHWHRSEMRGHILWMWAPPAGDLIVHDKHFPPGGDVVGFIVYTLTDERIAYELVRLPIEARKVEFVGPR